MKPNRSAHRIPSSRRSLALVLTAVALSAAACGGADTGTPAGSPSVSTQETADLANTLMMLQAKYNVLFGIAAVDPRGGRAFGWNTDDRFAMTATFTVYAVAAILRLAEREELDLNDKVPITRSDIVLNSPDTSYHVGELMSYYELCRATLVRSDNTAANLLLRRLGGPAAVTEFARSIGDVQTRLDRWEPELNEAQTGDPRDTSTPAALAAGYRKLILGDGLSTEYRRMLTSWLRSSVTSRERLRKGLPVGWVAADKSGSGAYGTANDAGVVWSPTGSSLVLVILSRSTTGYPMAAGADAAVADATAAVLGTMSQ
ncbi:class A beta-lactamase [Nocardia jinanensis]|uniref:Beta-lactamase n=1 Tax=Nocardia jinanensis TaxID=382504 RepID=A0A917VVZ9_9NOCA|nr:class A beta-lactamase [Nocardia jinanensis]GGL19469.1 beta-lactamase [Nocardia jinanensis]